MFGPLWSLMLWNDAPGFVPGRVARFGRREGGNFVWFTEWKGGKDATVRS